MSRNRLLLAIALVLFMFICLTWVQQTHTFQFADRSLLGLDASTGARGKEEQKQQRKDERREEQEETTDFTLYRQPMPKLRPNTASLFVEERGKAQMIRGLAAQFDELQIVKRFRARGVARGCSSTETHSAGTTQSEARAGGTLMHFGYWEGWGNMIEKYMYVEAIGQVAGKSVSHFRERCSAGNYNCHFTPNIFF